MWRFADSQKNKIKIAIVNKSSDSLQIKIFLREKRESISLDSQKKSD